MLKFNPCDRIKPASALNYLKEDLDINLKIEFPIICNKWERKDFSEKELKFAFIDEMNEWNVSKMEFNLFNIDISSHKKCNNEKKEFLNLKNNFFEENC